MMLVGKVSFDRAAICVILVLVYFRTFRGILSVRVSVLSFFDVLKKAVSLQISLHVRVAPGLLLLLLLFF